MNNKVKLLSIFVSLGLVLIHASKASAQQDTLPLSLEGAVKYALQNNTDIRNALLDLQSANRKIWETTAIGLPQVSAKAQYNNIFKVPELSFGSFLDPGLLPTDRPITAQDIANAYVESPPVKLGVKESTTFDFTVSQLLFNGSYIVGLQASRIYYQLSDQNVQRTQLEVASSVRDNYAMLLVAAENIRILRQTRDNVGKLLEETREYYRQGFVEQTDVDQLEVTWNNLGNSLRQVESSYDIGKRMLKIQLGIDPREEIKLTDSLPALINFPGIEQSLAQTFDPQRSIYYRLLETSERLARLDLNREKTDYLPSIAAYYNHQEKTKRPEFDFQPKDVVGISVEWNLFSSGQRMARVAQKRLALEKTRNLKDYQTRALQVQARQLADQLAVKRDAYFNNQKNLELARQIYERSLIKYREGVGSSLDLTVNQNQYLNALSGYYQSVFDLISAHNQLDKILNNLPLN
ncbi:MAG: hypothetical protein PWR20_1593 [Bacteroidales bacterium]|jgi:outer membrane protein TolC|nr:hypothetical protein [Bacteroidales bacterium]MDN5330728.1 hypothetical protein [Bacteroidales bacterium]